MLGGFRAGALTAGRSIVGPVAVGAAAFTVDYVDVDAIGHVLEHVHE
jgi:hypothetical protein